MSREHCQAPEACKLVARRRFTDAEIERARRLRASGHSYQWIADRLHTYKQSIARMEKRGWRRQARPERPCPGDLSLQAGRLTIMQLQAHYHASWESVRRWLAEKSIVMPNRQRRAPKRECPSDFSARAAEMTTMQLVRHYRVRSEIVRRWKIEHGLPVRPSKNDPPKPAEKGVGWVERYIAERRMAA